jgi:Asp-tRNA(Asn)/Glu-tRNA(Gln) amidotransferase A subunit family amidase
VADDELCWLTATEAARLFRERQVSPVELLEALIDRAERVEPVVNAFASTYYDEALEAARRSEARFARGEPVGPLEGLALVLKENLDSALEGTVSTDGTLWKSAVDDHTSPSVERLVAAGAIVHARTTMPELGWAWNCYTRRHGVTRNPWNPDFSPGGSSSGSAVSLAAGTTTLACATDALGSLRHPSAMCGILGFKPPYGRNPLHPSVNFDFFKHIGPMTRSVADSVLMQNVMSGSHPMDPNTVTEVVTLPAEFPDLKGLRIAYTIDFGCFPVVEDVRRETLATLDILREAGAEVVEVPVEWAGAVYKASARYTDHMYGDGFQAAVRDHPDEACDYTSWFAKLAGEVTAEEFHQALVLAGYAWRDHFGPLFLDHDAFVCPTLAFHHVPADNKPWEDSILVHGQLVNDHAAVMTGLFNVYSRCPVLATPSGFTSEEGLPTSVQIVGRPFDDVMVYRVAAAVERARPWYDTPAQRPALTAA